MGKREDAPSKPVYGLAARWRRAPRGSKRVVGGLRLFSCFRRVGHVSGEGRVEGCDEQTGGKELTYLTHNVACAVRCRQWCLS